MQIIWNYLVREAKRKKKIKEWKGIKKANRAYMKIIYTLVQFQKEKRGLKGGGEFFKKINK